MNMEVTTLDIIHDCRNLADSEDVEAVVTSLQRQVGIDGCILGFRERYGPRLVEDSCITSFGISSDWLHLYKNQRLYASDPVVQKAFGFKQPLPWIEAYRQPNNNSRDFIALSQDFRLMDGMSFADKSNRFSGGATCVSVTSERRLSETQLRMLHHILPHLNEAVAQPVLWQRQKVTTREKEILDWIKVGKSSWEISVILNVSERTVKFHLNNIYQKLEVHCRPQAVARALRLGIIDF
ncbi:LuxR C-terminal-related transcriptional regulator [Marinobacter salarius]|jgi:LuxR family transcriptional regulator, quorum-sensing system regulator CviR|uniref:LuxR C-terminal-related transcriptional regulator n=1 Tax=Marinobacter salarius TaxID=1420917 RepID=UPI003009A997|tara:strand:+ start:13454 stop:14167 length:714 start_codon:yes stop_codon:yes gene_type:complete